MFTGPTISVTFGPPNSAYTQLLDYQSGVSPIYQGLAKSRRMTPKLLVVTSVTAAAAAVVTIASHGLTSGNSVIISGATGDWAGLNGTQVITVINSNSFSVPVNSSAYASSFNGIMQTYAPQTSQPIWAIQKFVYSGTSLVSILNCQGQSGEAFIWDNRTSLQYQ